MSETFSSFFRAISVLITRIVDSLLKSFTNLIFDVHKIQATSLQAINIIFIAILAHPIQIITGQQGTAVQQQIGIACLPETRFVLEHHMDGVVSWQKKSMRKSRNVESNCQRYSN